MYLDRGWPFSTPLAACTPSAPECLRTKPGLPDLPSGASGAGTQPVLVILTETSSRSGTIDTDSPRQPPASARIFQYSQTHPRPAHYSATLGPYILEACSLQSRSLADSSCSSLTRPYTSYP
ncbi:hypothetical protein EVG20_g10234 [Dentipellis fragilis]|uniref:Uncharacterized protein n=1 Tax=Dentipellis fragilis TaxID=205917 RepID=A0A4Y9XSR3_9AGAM|nr:hypothetical protein EVG20_g10234 [Dentipellis fragilis]